MEIIKTEEIFFLLIRKNVGAPFKVIMSNMNKKYIVKILIFEKYILYTY